MLHTVSRLLPALSLFLMTAATMVGLVGMAKAFEQQRAQPAVASLTSRSGWACSSIARPWSTQASGLSPGLSSRATRMHANHCDAERSEVGAGDGGSSGPGRNRSAPGIQGFFGTEVTAR